MEEADKGWIMIRISEWVSVSSPVQAHPVVPRTKGPKNGCSSSSREPYSSHDF